MHVRSAAVLADAIDVDKHGPPVDGVTLAVFDGSRVSFAEPTVVATLLATKSVDAVDKPQCPRGDL